MSVVLLVSAVVLAVLAGYVVFRVLARREYERGVLAGQLQAELLHGWHQPVNADAAALRADLPRRRSPNEQFVWRVPSQSGTRPVLHD